MTAEKKGKVLRKTKQQKLNQTQLAYPLIKHDAGAKWYENTNQEVTKTEVEAAQIQEIEKQAELLLRRDVNLLNELQRRQNASEATWLNTVLIKGTANDKITAMQIIVKRSPVHALSRINALVSLVAKKNTREAFSILDTLRDILITDLLPPKRKLIPFSSRPVDRLKDKLANNDRESEKTLILWKFESELKAIYRKFVAGIERLANGNVEKLCCIACRAALDLIIQRPEMEKDLLSLLVNKLGHPNKTVAYRVCGFLLQLTAKHPVMRQVVVEEVERLIYRKNISCSAQLHAVSFLSQIDLRASDPSLATLLLKIYIGLFRMLVLSDKMDDKMLSCLLMATNRTFPYAKGEKKQLNDEIDTLYKVLHRSSPSTALQTLKLLYQLLSSSEGVSDRFYAALYRKLLTCHRNISINSQLHALVYEALKADMTDLRVVAFIKRLLQLSLNRDAPFAAASLLLVGKLINDRPKLLVTQKSADPGARFKKEEILSDDDEEIFSDLTEPDKEALPVSKCPDAAASESNKMKSRIPGWIHRNNIVLRERGRGYDSNVRNPLFAQADQCVASELLLLSHHYHPSVAVFASDLLHGRNVSYDGDPLHDFTTIRFLDRFVFRNPKIKKLRKDSKVPHRRVYDPRGVKTLSVTSNEYASKRRDEIPMDELFLHRYVSMKHKSKKSDNKDEVDYGDDDDMESVNTDEFDLLLNRFETGEKRQTFDVDFSREFCAEKPVKKQRSKRSASEDDVDVEEGDEVGDKNDGLGYNDDVESDNFCSDDDNSDSGSHATSCEEELSVSENVEAKNSSDSDDDFSAFEGNKDEFDDISDDESAAHGFATDAALSADKLSVIVEEKEDMLQKYKRKVRKARGFKKRKKN